MNDPTVQVIRVKSSHSCTTLADVIGRQLRTGPVMLRGMGAGAVNQMAKAVAISNGRSNRSIVTEIRMDNGWVSPEHEQRHQTGSPHVDLPTIVTMLVKEEL